MKRKKVCKLIGVMMMLVTAMVSLAGCSESIQTNEEIVVPKESEEEDSSKSPVTEGASGAAPGSLLSGIADQVQAPDRYTAELTEGSIHVKVDAPVIIPMAAGFKLYKVTGRVFNQEDYDNVNHVLLKDGKLWSRDYEAMAASNGFTREEIEERIARLKEKMEGDENKKLPEKEETYGETIAIFEEMLKAAPEEPVIAEIPAVVPYVEESLQNYLSGWVTVDGEDYFVALDNNYNEDWRWIRFQVEGPECRGSYMPAGLNEDDVADDGISPEKVKEEAKALMAELGFNEFTVAGEENVRIYSWDEETGEGEVLHTGYEIYFTRELDGIPITYTREPGTTIEGNDPSWPYEAINVVYGKEGLQYFLWANPYQVEEAGSEYVFLLPFSDIQAVFEKIMLKKHADWYQDISAEIYYEINEIRLGYMRVREKGNSTEGTMIPVWDFFGSETIIYDDAGETSVIAGPYESMLTINAMDGTVIDRGLGY